MRRHVPPPACSLTNIFDGAQQPLFPHGGPSVPTAVLFWAKWSVLKFCGTVRVTEFKIFCRQDTYIYIAVYMSKKHYLNVYFCVNTIFDFGQFL